ncbi:MAG: selenocysteine-specific translation elongation factor [Candidatus Brocadiia bacterium]
MKHLVAGTAGHIDHGKTVLIQALTGIDTDRLPEEKQRGISIALGYAYLDLPDGSRVGIVDVPGHERFVRTMVAGAAGVDFALLVVAADDSVMPQTREHLAILQLLGVDHGLVALTKIDLVDPELAEVAELEVREAVEGTFLAEAPIVRVSGLSGEGLDELRQAIAQVAASVPERSHGTLARLPIDRSFSVAGHGTVVTGTLLHGLLRVEEEVEILPRGRDARVRGLQSHGSDVDVARAGQRVAVNLAGVKHDELSRGDTVCTRGAFLPTPMVDGQVVVDPAVGRPLKHGGSVCFHLGTGEVPARVALLGRRQLLPGQRAWAQLRLSRPVVARRGDRFILRLPGGDATLGGGHVVDAHPLKHRRQRQEAAEALERVAAGGLRAAIAHELHKANIPLRLSELAPRLGAPPDHVEAACGGALRVIPAGHDPWVYDAELVRRLRQRAIEALAQRHRAKPLLAAGLPPAELVAKLDPSRTLTEAVVSAIMQELVAEGTVRRVGDTFALASHQVEFDDEQEAIREAILEACRDEPFGPPTVADLQQGLPYDAHAVAVVHEALLERGELVEGDICGFHPEAVEEAWRRLEAHLKEHGPVTMSEFRTLLGTTRRYALGLMHYFDQARRVVREGDYRRLAEGRS